MLDPNTILTDEDITIINNARRVLNVARQRTIKWTEGEDPVWRIYQLGGLAEDMEAAGVALFTVLNHAKNGCDVEVSQAQMHEEHRA